MSSASAPAATPLGTARPAGHAAGRYLYLGVAVILAAVVLLAFTRTFWTPLSAGRLALHPAIMVHAALFFLWMLFFVMQAALPLAGRTALHRDLGLFGLGLAAVMVFSGLLAQVVNLKLALHGPRPDVALTGAVLGFSSMLLFTAFVSLGMLSIRTPERHKRFMVLATFSILQAALARAIMLFPAITLPQRVAIGAAVMDVMLLGVVFLDARARGRVHSVYAWGGVAILLAQGLRGVLLRTDGFRAFASWLAGLGG